MRRAGSVAERLGRRLMVLGLMGPAACSEPGDGGGDDGADESTTTAGASSTAGSTTGVDGSGSTAGSTSGTSTTGTSTGSLDTGGSDGFIFDVGSAPDAPGDCAGERCYCNAVDLLFIVDNSGSMNTHVPAILAAFPMFVDQMVTALPEGTDLHVGLTRATGFYNPGNAGGWSSPTCEAALTDGVFYPPTDGDNGTNGQQGRLFEYDGMTYFEIETGEDPTPLEMWFQGALTDTIAGDQHSNTETVVAGAAYPFHPVNAMANAGFMRTNAVLVLFLLSDSPDLTPPAIPTSDFVDIVLDAKEECGGELCVVTSGAIAGQCYDQPGNTNTRLFDFMNAFGKPPASWISLQFGMMPNFGNVLGDALADAIATTCDEIVPEG